MSFVEYFSLLLAEAMAIIIFLNEVFNMDLYANVDGIYNGMFRLRHFLSGPRIQKELLNQNKAFRNKHEGERCFILGNGPSLKEDNLKLLQGETVFTVNQSYRNPDFLSIAPKYHFWVDRNFFNIDKGRPEDMELLECMKKCARSTDDIVCFYPIEQYDFVKENELLIDNRTFFIKPILHMGNVNAFTSDLSNLTYSFGTVVQNVIVSAIYMGFSEIYLLGCDSTGIINTLNASLKKANDEYGYQVSDNEKLRMERMVARSKVSDYAYSYYMTLKGFNYLQNVCEIKGVSLINCSATTVLDMIPRKRLAEVLKKE